MPNVDLLPPPGVNKEVDEYSAGPVWVETEKVRFFYKYPEKIGGWTKFNDTLVSGSARSLFPWRKLDGIVDLTVGTECFLYLYEGGTQYEVTPLRIDGASIGTDPFAAVSGSPIVTVTDSSHAAVTGDKVIFAGAGADQGITIVGDYILTVIDANSYTITHSANATSTGSGGGASVTTDYTLNCGPALSTFAPGWGALGWGGETWGDARTTSDIALGLRVWSLDNWGEDLIATPRGGGIYEWDVSAGAAGTRLTAVSNAPSQVNLSAVSPDRHLIAFGAHDGSAYDPLLVRWTDQGDNTQWTAAAGNQAGSKRIETGSEIKAYSKASRQIMVWTDTALWGMQFIGSPFVYSFQQLGANCGAVGPKSTVSVNNVTYWMGRNNFFAYTGSVQIIPSAIHDYVFSDINMEQIEQVYGASNKAFNEVWWFYPSKNSDEVDRYVVYQYRDKHWYYGTMDRLSWVDTGLFPNPIAVDAAGQLYYHEDGTDDVEDAITAFCTTGAFEDPGGENMLFMDKVIPSFKDMTGNMDFTIYAKQYPNSTERSKTRTVTASDDIIRPRIRGRQLRFKWSTSDVGNAWTMGRWRGNPRGDGDR